MIGQRPVIFVRNGSTGYSGETFNSYIDLSLLDAFQSADLTFETLTTYENYRVDHLLTKAKETLTGLKPLVG